MLVLQIALEWTEIVVSWSTYYLDDICGESIMDLDLNSILGDWQDPNPPPIIKEHAGIYVVRDDLFPYGSKARAADFLIGHSENFYNVKEWVYGSSPAHGYAQISIPYVCRKYDKKSVIFMAQRKVLHPYQERGIELGGVYHWVPNGMLAVTQKRARDYVAENPSERCLLPIGLDCIESVASLIRIAQNLPIDPKTVWCIASSGTLSWALQQAWPEAKHHMVLAGGHVPADYRRNTSKVTVHVSKYKFGQKVKEIDLPPFPSAIEYDAKAWSVLTSYRESVTMQEPILFWNVGA